MPYFKRILYVAWLVYLVSADVTQPFCKEPSKINTRQEGIPIIEQWINGHFEVEVTVPLQHQTTHIDCFTAGYNRWNQKSDSLVSFNGSYVLQKRDNFALQNRFFNITGKTCTTAFGYTRPLFASHFRYVSLRYIEKALNARRQFSSRVEYIDNNSTVRGLTLSHWKCCYLERILIHFFSDSAGNIMRMTITGKDIPTIHYDMVTVDNIKNRPLQFPRGVVCKGANLGYYLPPNDFVSFTATVVMIYPSHNFSTSRKEFYDNNAKLASSVIFALPGTAIDRRFGHGYLRVIRDYHTGLRYVIDKKRGNCTVEPMEHTTSSYLFAGPWDAAQFNVKKYRGLFDLHDFRYTLKNTVDLYGQPVQVYKAIKRDWPNYGINTTVELYYTKGLWPLGDDGEVNARFNSRLLGLWFESTAAESSSFDGLIPKVTQVPEYKEGVEDFSVFDISECYDQPTQVKRVVFSLPGCYCGIIRTRQKLLETTVQKYIVRETGIELIRVAEIDVIAATSSSIVNIWVTLFDIPPVKGDLPQSLSRIGLDEAVSRLRDAVDARPLVVAYPEGDQVMTFIRGSLRLGEEAKLYTTKGHSDSAMAIVAVTAAVIGLMLGLLVYVILWKKSQSPFLVE